MKNPALTAGRPGPTLFSGHRFTLCGVLVCGLLLLSACAVPTPEATALPGDPAAQVTAQPQATATEQAAAGTLRLMTHDSFDASPEVLALFEQANNVKLEILLSGDAGTMVNQAILSAGAPVADLLYGVDNTFLSRALEEDIFEVYQTDTLDEIPAQFRLDSTGRVFPVDYGDVCINYDIAFFEERGLAVPESLEDLLDPAYQDLLVVENPATSSPGLAFLFATIGVFGDPGYLDFWQALIENGTRVVNDWETAYFAEFTLWGGPAPLVVSYGSSPPFEVLFAEQPIDRPSTGAIVAANTCFRQIEFVGILKGTPNRELAEAWVEFMLSPTFQADIPLKMFVFPVNPQAELDSVFTEYLFVPEQPVLLDPQSIAENRERWIQEWTETVLR